MLVRQRNVLEDGEEALFTFEMVRQVSDGMQSGERMQRAAMMAGRPAR